MARNRQDIRELFFLVLGLTLALTMFFYLRWPLIDDAYITFRYAWHILEGHGCVYNTDERILGTTTPLWTYILAALNYLSFDFEVASVGISVISMVTLCLMFWHYHLRPLKHSLITLLFFPFALNFLFVHATMSSGMETSSYVLCVFLALHLLELRCYRWAVLACAGATLLRPDGTIIALVAFATIMLRSRQNLLPAIIVYSVVVLPWIYYAVSFYGSAIPHSVAAKQVLHPSSPINNLMVFSSAVTQNFLDGILFMFTVSGLIVLSRDARFIPCIVWVGLYFAGIIFSGVKPIYYWYYTPVWITLLTFGVLGILLWIETKGQRLMRIWRGRFVPVILSLLAVLVLGNSMVRAAAQDIAVQRDIAYGEIAALYRNEINDSDLLYFCETGILGYNFIRNRIIDASGINSGVALQYRKRAAQILEARGASRREINKFTTWSIELVKAKKPDWIVSPREWCQIELMENEGWFGAEYMQRGLYYTGHLGGIAVYQRRKAEAIE